MPPEQPDAMRRVDTLTLDPILIGTERKMADLNKLAEDIVGLTLLQAQELKTILKDKYGIEPAAGGAVMMAGPAAAAAPAVPKKKRPSSTSS